MWGRLLHFFDCRLTLVQGQIHILLLFLLAVGNLVDPKQLRFHVRTTGRHPKSIVFRVFAHIPSVSSAGCRFHLLRDILSFLLFLLALVGALFMVGLSAHIRYENVVRRWACFFHSGVLNAEGAKSLGKFFGVFDVGGWIH